MTLLRQKFSHLTFIYSFSVARILVFWRKNMQQEHFICLQNLLLAKVWQKQQKYNGDLNLEHSN